jgi:micrococcal nuclease
MVAGKKRNKLKNGKKLAATMLLTGLVAGGGWWTVKSGNVSFPVPVYQVERVVDGDTFVTKEKQIIRLLSIDAPELDRCGGKEAKKELEKLILGQAVYLKVVFKDDNRLIADVYSLKGSVINQLLLSGWVHYQGAVGHHEWKASSDEAKEKQRGIYGNECTQTSNPDDPDCVIKGNNRSESEASYYRFPGCRQYSTTLVQRYLGDDWFCTEKEAEKAGYIKGPDCLDKTWPNPKQ